MHPKALCKEPGARLQWLSSRRHAVVSGLWKVLWTTAQRPGGRLDSHTVTARSPPRPTGQAVCPLCPVATEGMAQRGGSSGNRSRNYLLLPPQPESVTQECGPCRSWERLNTALLTGVGPPSGHQPGSKPQKLCLSSHASTGPKPRLAGHTLPQAAGQPKLQNPRGSQLKSHLVHVNQSGPESNTLTLTPAPQRLGTTPRHAPTHQG